MKRTVLICTALTVVTAAVFWPVRRQQFVNFDDDVYVTDNPHVTNGLTLQGVRWAFTTTRGTHWWPLTWLSHMSDCQLFGLNAGAHKLVNVAFHIASTVLLFGVLHRMTRRIWLSALVAAVLAWHPLRVESVAWVAERKDVLCTFFWMMSLFAYVRYVERPTAIRYLGTVLSFILGFMAKPMIVTLPIVLLLLDFWPLHRAIARRRLIFEKLPLFALAAAGCIVTLWVSHSANAVVSAEAIPVGLRISNALISYARYLGKLFWPQNLAVLYPFPPVWPMSQVVLSGLLLVIISALAIREARRRPYLFVGWFWYLITLLPVIGLLQVGLQSMADRFTYIPLVGISICIAWGTADVVKERWFARSALAAGAAAVLACAVATRIQLHYWQNSVTLFRRAVAVTSGNFIAHGNLGVALCNKGEMEQGIAQLQEALRLSPDYAYAHNHLGRAYFIIGKTDLALAHLRKAVELAPRDAAAHNNLGIALAKEGQLQKAVAEFETAVRLQPDYSLARSNLGAVTMRQNRQ